MSAHTTWLICLQVLLSTCLLASALAHVDYTGHQLIRTRFDRSLDIYFENLLHTTSQTRDGRTGRGTSGTPTGGRRWFLAWAGSRKGCWYQSGTWTGGLFGFFRTSFFAHRPTTYTGFSTTPAWELKFWATTSSNCWIQSRWWRGQLDLVTQWIGPPTTQLRISTATGITLRPPMTGSQQRQSGNPMRARTCDC